MNIKAQKSRIKTLRAGDKHFHLVDGFVSCPRAGFEISNSCPKEYKLIISECINNGWLKPVAHMYSTEYVKDLLSY